MYFEPALGDKAQERSLEVPKVQSLEIFLKWRQQDGAHDEGDEQSRHSLTDVLPVASAAKGRTCLQHPDTRKNSGIPQGPITSRMAVIAPLLSAFLMCQSSTASKGCTA